MRKVIQTPEDIKAGTFLIDVYRHIETYRELYGELPKSVGVDKRNYRFLRRCELSNWINTNNMTLTNGVKIDLEVNWTGNFMSMRGKRYMPIERRHHDYAGRWKD